jgi:hypothetical protein
MFLCCVIRGVDPSAIRESRRVDVDIQESGDGYLAKNIKAIELPGNTKSLVIHGDKALS